MTADTPISLLQRLSRQPNDADWRRLLDIYSPIIQRWLTGFGISHSDIDDVSQEVFKTLLKEIEYFNHNGHTGAFRRWLRVTIVHRLKGYWRDRRTKAQLPSIDSERVLTLMEDPASDPNRIWDREHDKHVVGKLLEMVRCQFTESTWQAFCFQVLDGQKASIAADQLGMSTNAAIIAKSRVLRALRQEAQGLIDLDSL